MDNCRKPNHLTKPGKELRIILNHVSELTSVPNSVMDVNQQVPRATVIQPTTNTAPNIVSGHKEVLSSRPQLRVVFSPVKWCPAERMTLPDDTIDTYQLNDLEGQVSSVELQEIVSKGPQLQVILTPVNISPQESVLIPGDITEHHQMKTPNGTISRNILNEIVTEGPELMQAPVNITPREIVINPGDMIESDQMNTSKRTVSSTGTTQNKMLTKAPQVMPTFVNISPREAVTIPRDITECDQMSMSHGFVSSDTQTQIMAGAPQLRVRLVPVNVCPGESITLSDVSDYQGKPNLIEMNSGNALRSMTDNIQSAPVHVSPRERVILATEHNQLSKLNKINSGDGGEEIIADGSQQGVLLDRVNVSPRESMIILGDITPQEDMNMSRETNKIFSSAKEMIGDPQVRAITSLVNISPGERLRLSRYTKHHGQLSKSKETVWNDHLLETMKDGPQLRVMLAPIKNSPRQAVMIPGDISDYQMNQPKRSPSSNIRQDKLVAGPQLRVMLTPLNITLRERVIIPSIPGDMFIN